MDRYRMKGECVSVGPVETVGQRGFRKREIVLCEDKGAKYPDYLAWELVQGATGLVDESFVGAVLVVEGYPESHSWRDKAGRTRYFTSMKALKVRRADEGVAAPSPAAPDAGQSAEGEYTDDVPF